MNRLQANLKILELLKEFIKNNPDIRFGQAIRAVGIVDVEQVIPETSSHLSEVKLFYSDEFYTESTETLDRVKKRLSKVD